MRHTTGRKAGLDFTIVFVVLLCSHAACAKRPTLDTRVRFAIEAFAVELLEVIDNFERAMKAEDTASREGIEQISKLFRTILERHGIRRIEAVGKKFDPAEHEAIAYVPSDSEEGTVIDEVCVGYCMHDRIIRCAKVAVSKGKGE